jgi:hypothetical protein
MIPSDLDYLMPNAQQNIHNILDIAFEHTSSHRAIVVYDTLCTLSIMVTDAYRYCLPNARFMDFNEHTQEEILLILASLQPFDLVALIQSKNFRLEAFRLRVELFKRQLKVIEHPHLIRISDVQIPYYIESLAYDPHYYRTVGYALKERIDKAPMAIIESGGERLVYDTPLEPARLNIGDYKDMVNVGGQFPIGEVFTEAQELTALNGRVCIFAFSDTTYRVNQPDVPIVLIIQSGQVVACENSTAEFDLVLSNIRRDEGVVWVRELGLGLNRAFSKTRMVSDVGTFERMCGVHLSLGAKHGIYGKPGFKRGDGKYHVDVMVDTQGVILGDEEVFRDGHWVV